MIERENGHAWANQQPFADQATLLRNMRPFRDDPHADAPRILFIGHANSSHTHAWVDLVAEGPFNVRLFALPTGLPPDGWPVRTYVTASTPHSLDAATRVRLYAADRVRRYSKKGYARFLLRGHSLEARWLARIIREWRPDVIHTLGIDPAGVFYHRVRTELQTEPSGIWVVQLRGGSDVALTRFDPQEVERLSSVVRSCDYLIADNAQALEVASQWGLPASRVAAIAPLPGTGGIDVDTLAGAASTHPSSRRVIVWPKAYDCPWSKSLPVLEALTTCWDRLGHCEIYMLAMQPETRMWFNALPAHIKAACRVAERVPRRDALQAMASARLMLAPSLVDGVPNAMFEGMAAGALPVVSPLETITPFITHGENGLFARNLYPDDIADALVRGMTDDALIDHAAVVNRALVRRIADRASIRPRVHDWYASIASRRQARP